MFDERVAVGQGLVQGTHILCRACRTPLSPEAVASPDYVEGVQCGHCAAERSDEQRARYAERQKQVELAEQAGQRHIGDAAQHA